MTLADFLLARIAEDESVAREATPGHWVADRDFLDTESGEGGDAYIYASGQMIVGAASDEDAAFVERNDPERVLAECEAKRRIVERFAPTCNGYSELIAILALPYADHPDYREEWTLDWVVY